MFGEDYCRMGNQVLAQAVQYQRLGQVRVDHPRPENLVAFRL